MSRSSRRLVCVRGCPRLLWTMRTSRRAFSHLVSTKGARGTDAVMQQPRRATPARPALRLGAIDAPHCWCFGEAVRGKCAHAAALWGERRRGFPDGKRGTPNKISNMRGGRTAGGIRPTRRRDAMFLAV